MRRPLFVLTLLAPMAAIAQQPATTPVLRIPGLTAQGVAVLEKLKTQQNPAGPKQVRDEAALATQMRAVLTAPTLDIARFAAAQAQARVVAANGRKLVDDNILTILRALPPVDRKPFLAAITRPQLAAPAGPPTPGR